MIAVSLAPRKTKLTATNAGVPSVGQKEQRNSEVTDGPLCNASFARKARVHYRLIRSNNDKLL